MRKKPQETFNIMDDIGFGVDDWEDKADEKVLESVQKLQPQPKKLEDAEIDPNRAYSKYYKPHPKKSTLGGIVGRGAVPKEKKTIQYSLSLKSAQKQRFMEAADKEGRNLSNFICHAVEEYIASKGL